MSSSLAIIGTGYVGLTSGTCLAHMGHHVICVDVDEAKIAGLKRGEVPILEAGLDDLIIEGVERGNLEFTTDTAAAVSDAEFIFLCVPTPQGEDGSADLTYVQEAARTIGPHLKPHSIVVNKSTVPVGSTRVVAEAMGRGDVAVVSNPEFLREGTAVSDFLKPDRVVIGCDDQSAAVRISELYLSLGAPVLVTDAASAEMIKYASNAFLATKISFVNAMAAVCESVGADVYDVVLGMGYDKRIGSEFLRPGPGWGGSCFPKDSKALVNIADAAGYDFDLLKGVVAVNERQFVRVADKVEALAGGSLEGKTIAVWGLTFKALTDDLRDSPSIRITEYLIERGAKVRAFDPTVQESFGGIEVVADAYAACEGADVLAVLTEWDEFRWLDFDKVGEVMNARMVVDGRNLLDREALRRSGYRVSGIGRV